MKLYLSSYQLGNETDKLTEMVGRDKRAAVILNAIDALDDAGRQERLDREMAALQDLDFQPEEIDLRRYFDAPGALEAKLCNFGLLWIRGGNSFVLRKAMARSGFDGMVRGLLDQGIVYAGYSAASCVAGPTLRGVERCDDPYVVPRGYPAETVWDGLGLIDYAVAPHYKSDHPESTMIDDVVKSYVKNKVPYKTLRDGEVIIVND